ncbi:Hsp20/alpha crystallin family protein [Bacillus tianshenii]|nr:Hsp20/alpha crystallin family protein [Bacillus tianshenii]
MFDPFKQFQDFQKQFDFFFDQNFTKKFEDLVQTKPFPPVNIYRSDNELFVVLSLPGLKNVEQLDIYVEKNMVEVRGNIVLSYPGFECKQQEIFTGHFERSIPLPYPVIEERVDASYHKGLVLIHLHRLISKSSEQNKVGIRYIED